MIDESAKEWAAKAFKGNLEPLKGSEFFLCLFSGDVEKDALMCLQFGMAMFLDKPIIIICRVGQHIPENLRKVAKVIREVDIENHPTEAAEAIKQILEDQKRMN